MVQRDAEVAFVSEAIGFYEHPSEGEGEAFNDRVYAQLPYEGSGLVDAARSFLSSVIPRERAAAAAIIKRVCEVAEDDDLADEGLRLLLGALVTETDSNAREEQSAGIGAIWHCREDPADPEFAFVNHPNANFRYAAAKALALRTTDSPEDAAARGMLERLRRDEDEGVRGWAEYGLDTLSL